MSFSQLENFPKQQTHPKNTKMTPLPQSEYPFLGITMRGDQNTVHGMYDHSWTHIEPLQAWCQNDADYLWALTMDMNDGQNDLGDTTTHINQKNDDWYKPMRPISPTQYKNHFVNVSHAHSNQIETRSSKDSFSWSIQNQADLRQLQNPTRSSYSNENLPNNYQSENESYYQYYHLSGYSDTQQYHHKTKHHHTASHDNDPFSNVKGNSVNQTQQTNRSTKTHKTTQNIQLTEENCPSDGALQPLDIVCGRGAPTDYHYGNQVFRDIVEDHYTKYLCAKRSDKAQIAMKIMDIVKSKGGKFVRRQKSAGRFIWEPIGDKAAYEKVCQALRDGSPQLHRQMLSTVCIKEHKAPSPVPSCTSERN